jgi:cupin fold WbuC family metalloprotein
LDNPFLIDAKFTNNEVIYTQNSITTSNANDIAVLKDLALKNERKRVRLCAHLSTEDILQNMLIVLAKGCDIIPHKHIKKAETFHIIEGELQVLIFDDYGTIQRSIDLGEYSSGKSFFYRLSEDAYHTVVPITNTVVFHESTSGPFDPSDTLYPTWATAHIYR